MKQNYLSWDLTKLGKPYYFFFYYISKWLSETEAFSKESIDIQKMIWKFKDGINQQNFTELVIEKIKNSFDNVDNLTFACIPASTTYSNISRFKSFSKNVCDVLGINNAFDHIKIIKEKSPKHVTNIENYCVLDFDKDFFRGKSVILFDDVVTKGNSMRRFISQLENIGAKVLGCISIGRTYYERVDEWNPAHPWSETAIRSGIKVEPAVKDIFLDLEEVNPTDTAEENTITPVQYAFGDVIKFGTFYDNPIEWEVLEQKGNKVLLISKYGLTCREYNKKLVNTTWAECSLRKWLNDVFFERSFSTQEKEKMIRHLVNAEVVSGHELNPGENTKDFVHILSVDDYLRFYEDKAHHWKCYLLIDKQTMKQCWLRNYGFDRTRAAFIGRSGSLHLGGSLVDKPRNTVRPVILIKV